MIAIGTMLAGPYVDFICTHEYTFTLAAPVRHAGQFIGVAAADILATQVERLVLPGLSGLGQSGQGQSGQGQSGQGRAAVLASGHGRVIASTSASLPPGIALPRQSGTAGLVRLAGPGLARPPGPGQPPGLLPWTLLSLPHRGSQSTPSDQRPQHDQRRVVPVRSRPAG